VLAGRQSIFARAVRDAVRLGAAAGEERRNRDRTLESWRFSGSGSPRRPVGGLPYGTQKLVEIGRALAMEPRLLLLDETDLGHDPGEASWSPR